MLKRVAVTGGVALAMSLTVVGCGSGTAVPPAGAGSEIVVGVLGSYTGAHPTLNGPSRDAIEAWASTVNDAGGLRGQKVKLIVKDDKGDAATAVTAVKSMINEDKIVAIVGQQSSNSAPWAKIASAAGVPVVGGNTYDFAEATDANFFPVGGNLISGYYGIAQLALERGGKVGNLYCSESPSCAATTALLKAFGGGKLEVVFDAAVSASAPDYTAVCQSLKASGAESFSLGMAAPTIRSVTKQCVEQGFKKPLIIPDVADATFAGDPAFEGTKYTSALMPFYVNDTPAMKAFHDALKKYAPTLGSDTRPLTATTVAAWASGKLFEAAVAKIDGAVTSQTIKDALYAMNGETLGGISSPLSFNKGKPSLHNCYFYYEIKGGSFVSPKGNEPICAPDALINEALAKLGA